MRDSKKNALPEPGPALLRLFDGGTDGTVADVGPDDLTVRNTLAILMDKRDQIGE